MINREFSALDTCGRTRVFAESTCNVCSANYTRQKRLINQYNTCSLICTNVAKGRSIICECAHCGESIIRSKSDYLASKSGKLFCSRVCKDTAQTYMKEIQPSHYGDGEFSYREKAFRHYSSVCMECGYNKVEALEVHHIDKNRKNNNISNLEILCANCHTLRHKGLRAGAQR